MQLRCSDPQSRSQGLLSAHDLRRGRALGLLAGLTVAAGIYLQPTLSQACGGTFCDAGPPPDPGQPPPPPMPVDQTGETIIFVADGDHVEAHIQIEFDPESGAERFAWLIPMAEVPEFGVSSDAFFDAMQIGTVPVFSYSSGVDFCGGGGSSTGGSGGGFCEGTSESTSGSTDGGYEGGDDSGVDGSPEVVQHGFAGAFEYYVLDGGTVEGVYTWLEANDFETNPDAEPIIESYLNQGHVFVAMKLAPGEGSSAIHPISLRFLGDEFCVPLRLTAIAAAEDMAVRVMVLGHEQAAPANWAHVVPNPAQFSWLDGASNYEDVLKLAIDEGAAGGHAWVTEFAGLHTTAVDASALVNPLWDAAAFDAVTPETFVDVLRAQSMLETCDENAVCTGGHELGPSLIDSFLPVPEGVNPEDFYDCVECFAGLVDDSLFDPVQIRAAVEERIIGPATHASDLLATYPMLTRMVTYISPYEMTEDPTFLTNPDPRPVFNWASGHRQTNCSGTSNFNFDYAGSWALRLWGPDTWPTWPDEMPYALRVEQVPAVGAPIVVEDNDALIRDLIDQVASTAADPRSHDPCGGGTEGGEGGWDETGSGGSDHGPDISGRGGSCACSSEGSPDPVPTALAALWLLGWTRRRRTSTPQAT